MNLKVIKLIILTLLTCTVAGIVAAMLADPYFFTPKKKLYKTGVAKMEEAIMGNRNAYNEAAIYFNALIKKGSTERETFDRLYWCYRFNKDHQNAELTADRALKVYPNDIEFLFHRAESQLDQQEYRQAIEDYDQVIAAGSDFRYLYDAIYSRGAAKYKLGEKEKSEEDRAQAIKLAPFELDTYDVYFSKLK